MGKKIGAYWGGQEEGYFLQIAFLFIYRGANWEATESN